MTDHGLVPATGGIILDFLTIRNIVIYGIYGVDNVYTTVILSAEKEKPFTMIQLAANKHLCHCEGLFT